MSLFGDAAALNALQKLSKGDGADKGDESNPAANVWRAKPGKKLAKVGRSNSDGMLALMKKHKHHKPKPEDDVKKDAKPEHEFRIPSSNHGKSKHFGMREEHVAELGTKVESS